MNQDPKLIRKDFIYTRFKDEIFAVAAKLKVSAQAQPHATSPNIVFFKRIQDIWASGDLELYGAILYLLFYCF